MSTGEHPVGTVSPHAMAALASGPDQPPGGYRAGTGADATAVTLADIMTSPVTTVPADYSVHWALALMRGQRISALVVTDAGRPVGIFTERDAVRFAFHHRDAEAVPISEAMGSPPITAPTDMRFRDAYQLVNAHGVRHLIVVDAAGQVAGITSEAEFIAHLAAADLLDARTVGAVMTQGAITLPEDALVGDAVNLMASHRLGSVVVERHGRPVGIITERDLVRLGAEGIDFGTTPLTRVMSHPVHTVTAAESLATAIGRMELGQTRRLVVVDEGGSAAGIVTRHDVVKLLRD